MSHAETMKSVTFKSEFFSRSLVYHLAKRRVPFVLCILMVLMVWVIISYQIFVSVHQWSRFNKFNMNDTKLQLDLCPITSKNLLGKFVPNLNKTSLDEYDERMENVFGAGGHYKPIECISRDRVAILIPVRHRDDQIAILLQNLQPLLMRQQIEFQIFIVHQGPGYWFNRGALFNVGFIEALKFQKWDCVILHDVDTVPIDDRNLYICPRTNPRHMGAAVDKFNYSLIYQEFFGTVSALTVDQYQRINGHANSFWGWGGEDNDAYNRVKDAGYEVERYPLYYTKYISLTHTIESRFNPTWSKQVEEGRLPGRFKSDGLNSIKYHIKNIRLRNAFTSIFVDFIPEEMGRNSKEVIEKEKN